MKILVTGPAGSGKTTQAKIIAQKLNLCMFKVGELLRRHAQNDPDLQAILDKGDLADFGLAADTLKNAIESSDCPDGFVVDGYPRDLKQLDYFDPEFDKVFYLNVPDEEVIKRMVARGRSDDNEEAIIERLKIYHEQTNSVLKYYQTQGKLIEINGNQEIEKVSEEILKNV